MALDRFITFAALALHDHPDWAARLAAGAPAEPFVHEVRRYYPFFPLVAARTRRDFDWRGYHVSRGRRVLLDLYGTNRHPGLWSEPARFRPERFDRPVDDPYRLVPQGGGDHWSGHRCAGEWVTIEVMKHAVELLTRSIRYQVPEQDLTVDPRRMPTLPRSGLVLSGIARVGRVRPVVRAARPEQARRRWPAEW